MDLNLIHLAHLALAARPHLRQRPHLQRQPLVVYLEEAHPLHVAGELVVELGQLPLLALTALDHLEGRSVPQLARGRVEQSRARAATGRREAPLRAVVAEAAWDRGGARRYVGSVVEGNVRDGLLILFPARASYRALREVVHSHLRLCYEQFGRFNFYFNFYNNNSNNNNN